MPNVINLLNGLLSLAKYGMSGCNGGFAEAYAYGACVDDGSYSSSIGYLNISLDEANTTAIAQDLSLVLTGGRLSDENRIMIEQACENQPNNSTSRCIMQLMVCSVLADKCDGAIY